MLLFDQKVSIGTVPSSSAILDVYENYSGGAVTNFTASNPSLIVFKGILRATPTEAAAKLFSKLNLPINGESILIEP